MLSFAAYSEGKLADKVNLSGAYLVGSDDIPLRADITFAKGIISCKKRAAGPAGLALLWEVSGVGSILLETIRVQERDRPYILQVELARGRLMRLLNKLEDWGLLDHADLTEVLSRVDEVRGLVIQALQADTPAEAASIGEEALRQGVVVSEDISHHYAALLLERKKQSGGLSRPVFGCAIHLDRPSELSRKRLASAFDFVTVPIVWRDIEPSEQTFNWKPLDAWVELLSKHNIPIRGSALLSFSEKQVPDWLYIWEHDFDTIRDLAFEHACRVINRYGQYIQTWVVASGIHATNCFTFNFEQLMELTRMTAALTKQLCPRGTAIIELVAPWGEYYARNQRTIPPTLYADMAVQSGINFDAFGLKCLFGLAMDGMYVRDMFQVSAMLDHYCKLGKPLHITGVEVPSSTERRPSDVESGASAVDGGMWHEPWSEEIQARWLRQFAEIALSKSAIETIAWQEFVDHQDQMIPHGGLLREDLTPKTTYDRLVAMRSELFG